MQECGVEPFEVPTENYHILPPEEYKNQTNGHIATTICEKQGIFFNAKYFRNNPVNFGLTTIHETLHLKAHTAFEVDEAVESPDIDLYRAGVSSYSASKNKVRHEHFGGLHEAIVATQEKKMFPAFMELPILSEEKEWIDTDRAKDIRKKISKKEKMPENEILWVYKGDEENWEGAYYYRQRLVLNYICQEIQKEFSEQFQSTDEVFKEFLKAHFTGHLLTIAKLIEKTFGEGSFRSLGNMSADRNSGALFLESFKKMRTKLLENK